MSSVRAAGTARAECDSAARRRIFRGRVAPRTTLDCDNVEPFVGELIGNDRSGPAETDDDNVLLWKLARHEVSSTAFRRPIHSARDADGRKRKALVVTVDPVEIVVARARVPDHPPRDHVAVAAIDRIGKETLLHVIDRLLEKRLSVGALELHAVVLETTENTVLVAVAELREGFAGIVRATIAVEGGQALAIFLRRPGLGLRSLLLGSHHEGWAVVEALLPAIGTGHLAVDVDGASGVFSARRIRVRRNDAVREGFDGAALRAGEEKPRARLCRNRRISRGRLPGKIINK